MLHKAVEMFIPTHGKGWQQCGSVHLSSSTGLCEAEAYMLDDL